MLSLWMQFMASLSVTKLRSYQSWLPSIWRMTDNWSCEEMRPKSSLELGDSGKQESPRKIQLSLGSTKPFSTYLCEQNISSLKMQPIPQISAEVSYLCSTRMTSGGRYHREQTWLESSRFLAARTGLSLVNRLVMMSFDSRGSNVSSLGRDLESPKSQIFMLQSASTKMLLGLMSLWMTLHS